MSEIKPVAWRYKDYTPLLNGGYAFGYTHDPESHLRDEPLYDQSAIDRLTEERDAAVADAERWRKWITWIRCVNRKSFNLTKEIAEIDAAMKEKEQGK